MDFVDINRSRRKNYDGKKISYFIKIGEKIIKNKREWKTKKRTRKISDA